MNLISAAAAAAAKATAAKATASTGASAPSSSCSGVGLAHAQQQQKRRPIRGPLSKQQQRQQPKRTRKRGSNTASSVSPRIVTLVVGAILCLVLVCGVGICLVALKSQSSQPSQALVEKKRARHIRPPVDERERKHERAQIEYERSKQRNRRQGIVRGGGGGQPQHQPRQQRRQESAATDRDEYLVLTFVGDEPEQPPPPLGQIRIRLLPEYSPESVEYVKRMVRERACGTRTCNLYRAEVSDRGVLQGMIDTDLKQHPDRVPLPAKKGDCPEGYERVANDCPAWDARCGCHGPVMKHGAVAWAAGGVGPDFFVNGYRPSARRAKERKRRNRRGEEEDEDVDDDDEEGAIWWGTQHTVWGRIADEASFRAIDRIWTLPTTYDEKAESTYLDTPIPFQLSIMSSGSNEVEEKEGEKETSTKG